MDQRRFDDLTRLLGASGTRRSGLRAALGALGLLGAASVALDADARRTRRQADADADRKRRRKRCKPACTDGYECVKVGRKRACQCRSGVTCGTACCAAGEACIDGACAVGPEPPVCIPAGEPCKNVGRPCCDGRTCSSGQGGEMDIACYVHKTGACRSTADCVYGTVCRDGRCGLDVPPPAALGAPCDAAVGQLCADPAAACVAYEGANAPAGTFCTLPRQAACVASPDCTSDECGYGNPSAGGSVRAGGPRAGAFESVCCGSGGLPCAGDGDCCLGSVCVSGTCQVETVCDVCKSGACPYLTVGEAVDAMPAGSTIRVAPDTYAVDSSISVGKTLTIRPCGAASGVALESPGGNIVRMWPDDGDFRLTLVGIEFRPPAGDPSQPVGVTANGSSTARATLRVANCTFRDNGPAIRVGQYVDIVVDGSLFDGSSNSLISLDKTVEGGSTFTATRSAFRNSTDSAIYLGNVTATLTDCAVVGGGGYDANQKMVGGAIYFLVQGTTDGSLGGPPNRATLTLAGSTSVSGASAVNSGGGVAVISKEGAIASLVMTGTSRIQGNAITGPGNPTPDGSGLVYFLTTTDGNFTASGVTGRVTGNSGGADQCAMFVDGDGVNGYYIPLPDCLPSPFCLENAAFCSATSNACCTGDSCGDVTSSISETTEKRCCLALAAACTPTQACCDTAGDRATCQNSSCKACIVAGQACTNAIDCCSESCQSSVCQP